MIKSFDSPGQGPGPVALLGEASRKDAHRAYRRDHPRPTTLLLMRFDNTPTMRGIDAGVRAAAGRHGRDVVRADDRDYTGELWTNVALCMHHSDLVIAVLDQVEKSDCDANVMVELGFALAAGLRCLILVERRLHEVPAVLRHRLAYTFDALELPGSIDRQVDDWLARNKEG